MKFATERDLSKIRGQLGSVVNDTVTACSSTSFALKLQAAASMMPHPGQTSNDYRQSMRHASSSESNASLKPELQAAKDRLEAAQSEIRAKDERILQLVREVLIVTILIIGSNKQTVYSFTEYIFLLKL